MCHATDFVRVRLMQVWNYLGETVRVSPRLQEMDPDTAVGKNVDTAPSADNLYREAH